MDQRYRVLKRNTIIIAISNICSKAIAFILAPIYSYFLTPGQYGAMDLVTTTVSLMTPIICLDIYEATFRFSNEDGDKRSLISSSLALSVPSLIVLCISLLLYFLSDKNEILIFTAIYLALNVFCNILEQYARGNGSMRIFAIAGILNSAFLLIFNLIFMILLKLELTGWFISFVLAKAFEVIYLFISTRIWTNFKIKYIQKELIIKLLKYCLPLLPTTTMWWVMNASDRYMLTLFMGTSVTGIYAVSNKIPSILSLFERIFYQSWQTAAIQTKNEKDYTTFYSQVFNKYLSICSVGILIVMLASKPIIRILFDYRYHDAWVCAMPLLIAVLIHSLSGNLGTIYVAFQKTKGALFTSFWGAITNIVLNVIFIPLFGMMAAAFTTLIGYFVTLIVRWIDVKKFVRIKIDYRNLLIYFFLIVINGVLYYSDELWGFVVRCISIALVFYKERRVVFDLIKR